MSRSLIPKCKHGSEEEDQKKVLIRQLNLINIGAGSEKTISERSIVTSVACGQSGFAAEGMTTDELLEELALLKCSRLQQILLGNSETPRNDFTAASIVHLVKPSQYRYHDNQEGRIKEDGHWDYTRGPVPKAVRPKVILGANILGGKMYTIEDIDGNFPHSKKLIYRSLANGLYLQKKDERDDERTIFQNAARPDIWLIPFQDKEEMGWLVCDTKYRDNYDAGKKGGVLYFQHRGDQELPNYGDTKIWKYERTGANSRTSEVARATVKNITAPWAFEVSTILLEPVLLLTFLVVDILPCQGREKIYAKPGQGGEAK